MNCGLNLKLKDGVEPSVLLKYGFLPKYDEDTGKIKSYRKKIHIVGAYPEEQHFSFILYTKHIIKMWRRRFEYEAWMTGFTWNGLCHKEVLQTLYDLIIDGIVVPAEMEGNSDGKVSD